MRRLTIFFGILIVLFVLLLPAIQRYYDSAQLNQACGQQVRNPDVCNAVVAKCTKAGYHIMVSSSGRWSLD